MVRLTLHAILEELQVPRSGVLYVQSSTDWLQKAGFSATDTLAALIEWTRGGALVMPAYPFRVTHAEYLASRPRFDVNKTPAAIGLIPEVFRRTAGVRRSLDPDFSIAALGADAADIVATRSGDEDPFSETSVYARLLKRDATLLGLGVSLNTNSFIHVIDSRLSDRYPRPAYAGRFPADVVDGSGADDDRVAPRSGAGLSAANTAIRGGCGIRPRSGNVFFAHHRRRHVLPLASAALVGVVRIARPRRRGRRAVAMLVVATGRRHARMTSSAAESSFRPSVSMLGWGLDERENLPQYLERAEQFLRSVADDFELIVVDDGSSDGMWEAAVDAQRTRPWLKVLKNDRNRGAAYSAKRAIREASKDYLFWQTMDWAYDISGLSKSFPLLQQFDILQGVRVNALRGTAFSLRSDTTLEGTGLAHQLPPGPAAVPVAAQRLPERDGVSAGADPVLRVRDRQFVHESRAAAQGVVVGRVVSRGGDSVHQARARRRQGHAMDVDRAIDPRHLLLVVGVDRARPAP